MDVIPLDEHFRDRRGLTITRPEGRYVRPAAHLVNEEVALPGVSRRYMRRREATTLPEGVAEFADATVFDAGAIRAGRDLIRESVEKGDAERIFRVDPDRPPLAHYEAAVHFCKRGSANYGHFLVEMLPRLLLDAALLPPDAPILLHQHSKKFALTMMKQVGIDTARVKTISRRPVRVGLLHWPLRNTTHPMSASPRIVPCLQQARDRMLTGRPASPDGLLFISRRDAPTRQLLNDASVFAMLQPFGFRWVEPGRLSFREQVETFSSCRMLVAAHGAAMTNLVFMPTGGTVIMLTSPAAAGFFFWDLAYHADLSFHAVFGDVGPHHPDDKNVDYRVDAAQVRALVRELL